MGKPRCLETRSRHGMRLRRYRNIDGTEYYTYELPITVFDALVLAAKDERWYRAMSMQSRHKFIEACLREGWKPLAVASAVNMSLSVVRKIHKKIRNERT